jgi:hypothetical protein
MRVEVSLWFEDSLAVSCGVAACDPLFPLPNLLPSPQPSFLSPTFLPLLSIEQMRKLLIALRNEYDEETERQHTVDASEVHAAECVEEMKEHVRLLNQRHEDLASMKRELQDWVAANGARTLDVEGADAFAVPSTVLDAQLIDLTAEAAAIEDTFYVLQSALENGVITASVYVQKVRALSKKQFKCIALSQQIHEAQRAAHMPGLVGDVAKAGRAGRQRVGAGAAGGSPAGGATAGGGGDVMAGMVWVGGGGGGGGYPALPAAAAGSGGTGARYAAPAAYGAGVASV